MSEVASTDLISLYEGSDYTSRYHDSAGTRILRLLDFVKFTNKDRVLDIGCGNGLLLPEIIEKIKYYDGIDFSKAFIKEAETRGRVGSLPRKKYNYHVGDVIEFCKDKTGYDKVFALDFTEHVNNQEFKDIFSAVRKSMKKGGQLIAHTPNKDFLLERLKSEEIKIKKQGHIGLRNGEEYKRLLKQVGFKKVEVIPLSHYVSILKPLHIFSYIPVSKVSTLFQARLLIICEA